MSLKSFPRRGDRGFTLIEVTVAMAILVIVLVLSGSLLFSMKSFAQRQQSFAEPRQTARRALEYLSFYVRGATDMNLTDPDEPAPNALVVYYTHSSVTKQATFDNVNPSVDGAVADAGTDVLTLGRPAPGSMDVAINHWTGNATSAQFDVNFTAGCPDDNANLALFKQLVGYDPSNGNSNIFMIYDAFGTWQYYQITNFHTSTCSTAPQAIHLNANTGGSAGLDPPGGFHTLNCPDSPPCYISGGIQFITFRVRTVGGVPRLEQLILPGRLFDPALDNPGTSFTPLLDNVEDLQIAYIYDDGTVWNSSLATRRLPSVTYPHSVPAQDDPPAKPYDITHVRGIRMSVVTRSDQPLPTYLRGVGRRGVAVSNPENSTVAYASGYYRYRLTATVMLRNRILGN
jgi:prepilin-type N-terminal cleavage/methylation domain-containing protein